MVRFSRTRRQDPVFCNAQYAQLKSFYECDQPVLNMNSDDVVMTAKVSDLRDTISSYYARKQNTCH